MDDKRTEIPSGELDASSELRIRREKLAALVESGNDPYVKVKFDKNAWSGGIIENFEKYDGSEVKIAGRIVSRRIMGKAAFCHVLDGEGTIQVYVKKDEVGEQAYDEFKTWDTGDIIGVCGTVFRTHSEEISVKAGTVELLAKSLLPLPEKFHGFKDNDLRYRQRYVDLIANPEVKKVFVTRTRIISAVREYLDGLGYIEVDTPILNTIPGGASARPFITHHNTLDIDMYMRIATELYLKRLIVGGFEKVYEMGRIFRNEGMSTKHNPEFTTVELYEAYADYHAIMDLTENMFRFVADKVLGTRKLVYGDTEINLDKWEKLTMVEAVKKYAKVDFSELDDKKAVEAAKKLGAPVAKGHETWGYALYEVFDVCVEQHLIQPTFIYDYPTEVSPLAKKKPGNGKLTERFEFFITAREMGNAFSELNDPIDQKERFLAQVKERETGDDEAQMMDDDFVTALEYGMPPTGGLGVGIDRMVMLFTNQQSIRDVLLFPTMKPLKK